MVSLVSKEGKSYEVPTSVAKLSKMVEDTMEDKNEDEVQEILLPNVRSEVLKKVIKYCTHYHMNP